MYTLNERIKRLEGKRTSSEVLPALYTAAMQGTVKDLLLYLTASKGQRFDERKQAVYARLVEQLPD